MLLALQLLNLLSDEEVEVIVPIGRNYGNKVQAGRKKENEEWEEQLVLEDEEIMAIIRSFVMVMN